MKRVFVYLSALVGMGGMVYLAGLSQAQPPAATPPASPPATRCPVAVFNMAAVMRDYEKAKYQVYLMNQKRVQMSGDLAKWRTEYVDLQKAMQSAVDPKAKDEFTKKLVVLSRQIQDKDQEINKALNDEASKIISRLYVEIKTVVDKTAEMNAYQLVFAYPDGVTPEELNNPAIQELKLKPPAAQPFFIAGNVDCTGVVIKTLNGWYPPLDANNQKVDVSKLPPLEGMAPPGGAPAGAPQGTPGTPAAGAPGQK